MIRVEHSALQLLGMLGVDISRAKSSGENVVELPSDAFAHSQIQAGELELATRATKRPRDPYEPHDPHDLRVNADAIALYAAFAASCTKHGVGVQTEHVRTAFASLLEQLVKGDIPNAGSVSGRLVALRKSISALFEDDSRPETVALARAAFAAVSESFAGVAAQASAMVLRGVTLGDQFPESWERRLEYAAQTEADIRQRAAERGGTPNKLTFVSDIVEKIEALGGKARLDPEGKWVVSVNSVPISNGARDQLSKMIEAIAGEMSRLGALIPAAEPVLGSEPLSARERFWSSLKNHIHDRVFAHFIGHSPQSLDAFSGELLAAENRLADVQSDAFLRLGQTLLESAEKDANVFTQLWMKTRDRWVPGSMPRADMLDALADELLSKICTEGAGEDFDVALTAFAKRAHLSKEQHDALARFADELGAWTKRLRHPLESLGDADFEHLAEHFDDPKKDSAFYSSEAGRRAIAAIAEMQKVVEEAQSKLAPS